MRVLLCLFAILAAPAFAAPKTYALDTATSKAEFIYDFEGSPARGRLPVTSANIVLDFDRLQNSKVSARLNTRKIKTGFVFATEALRGDDMLATASHPSIQFSSTSISGRTPKAKVKGNLTIRGVTRPVTFDAELFRPKGTDPNDLSRIIVIMTGKINRNDFGITGYKALVKPTVTLRIEGHLTRR